jgi:CspA family cold shock protein
MATGKVKWFNNAKGYGFILAHTGGEDLFVHYSSIQMDGYKTLKAGQSVEFDIQQGPKGLHAVNIRCDAEAADSAAPSDAHARAGEERTAAESSR